MHTSVRYARWILMLGVALHPAFAVGSKRALVIANSGYAPLPALSSSPLEAQLIRPALEKTGFEITFVQDATLDALGKAEAAFVSQVNPGDVCLFYYAGYAVQFHSTNYLIPVDYNPAGKRAVTDSAFSVQRLQDDLSDRRAALKFILMEARQDPALTPAAGGPGLANPDPGDSGEIVFAFAASPNQPLPGPPAAAPGKLTEYLAQTMVQPRKRISEIFDSSHAPASGIFFLPKLDLMRGFFLIPPARYALLIANSRYASLPPLSSSALEAKAMRAALEQAHFQISYFQDTTFEALDKAKSGFLSRLEPGDVGLVYYAGYAMQFKGDNYLVPINYDPATMNVTNGAFSVTGIQQDLEDKKPALEFILLEAAHEAPALTQQSGARGLTNPDPEYSKEIVFAFSAYANQLTPRPPEGGLGKFTDNLAKAITVPGRRVRDVFDSVQAETLQAAGQQILLLTKLANMSDFYFIDPPPPPARRDPWRVISALHVNRRDREEYVWIPPGKFQMGCVTGDKRCKPDENPRHEVQISRGFFLGATPVDNEHYKLYAGQQKDKEERKLPPGPMWDKKLSEGNHPIVNVHWEQAVSYCHWAGGRLPTEAEWEYAARGGQKHQIYPFTVEDSRNKANFSGKSGNDQFENTSPVKFFDRSPWGLWDMAGNVWEWTSDWYNKDYYAQSPAVDPPGPGAGKEHVNRGGSFDSVADEHLRISIRHHSSAWFNVGFRCVLEDSPDTVNHFDR